MSLHKNVTSVDVHILYAYSYANAAARTGATGFVSADLGKVAWQTDTNTFWVLIATTPTWTEITGGTGSTSKAILHWGNNSVSSTTTTRYLQPGFVDGVGPTTVIQYRVPFAATLKNLRVRHNTTAGNGNAIVYTVRINSVASTLTVSVNSTTADGSDVTHTPTVAAGDLIDIEVTKAASVGTSPGDIMASLEIDAT